ncbi:MAG: o-succinylbenzoate synthase, partial [Proteobacteria bacterium]|nr:o-succinylbenzoate synthase [Pseudomonadota bacterium]
MTRQLPPVTLDHVELVRVHLPLVRPFRTSFGVQHVRDALLVHVRDA